MYVCVCGWGNTTTSIDQNLEVFVEREHLLGGFHSDSGLRVFGNSLLKEVSLALQRYLKYTKKY